jgi:hypothetical protein
MLAGLLIQERDTPKGENMSKFFGRLFEKRATAKPIVVAPYVPPKLTEDETALATLIYCVIADKMLPPSAYTALTKMVPEELVVDDTSKELLTMWQNRKDSWSGALDEMQVLLPILLEQTIRESRKENKDFVPLATATPVQPNDPRDIFDKIGW